MGHILGINGYTHLAKGYPVNINDADVKPFTVSANAAETGIEPGSLLVYDGTGVNSVTGTDALKSATDYKDKVAGIALATNVKLDTVFPQSVTGTNWLRGQAGGRIVRGEVAVKLGGSAPKAGQPVFYDIANAAFTATEGSNLALPNMTFSGITEGTLTVVNIRY